MTSFKETGIYSYGPSQVSTCGPPITTIVRVNYYRLICLAVTKLKSIPIPIIPLKNHWGIVVDLTHSQEDIAFREEVRQFLKESLPPAPSVPACA